VTTPARSQLPVAVVTGGNRGVGLEVCRQLAVAGYAVVLGSRDPRKGELAAKEIDPEGERITPCHIEVDNSVNIEQLAGWVKERYGRLDSLVNNASAPPDLWAIAGNTDLTPVAEALDINLFGTWRVTQALLPLLRRSSRPRIVNVSSEGGSIALMNGGRPAYSVSKAALNALTKLLAGELHRDGILVNAVCPGWMPNDGSRPGGRSRSYAQGAASVVWAATLPNGGPTGTFTRDGRALPWLSGTCPGRYGRGRTSSQLAPSGLASGQPPAASRARTLLMSASLGVVSVTSAIAFLIASADSGLEAASSSVAMRLTSSFVSSLPRRANSGM
jgi:NAD(P)-dependent dehydrogenase (short-subunit alcohol dehydrogenase family)